VEADLPDSAAAGCESGRSATAGRAARLRDSVEYAGTIDFVSRLFARGANADIGRLVEGEDDMDVSALPGRVFIEFVDLVLESCVNVAGTTSLFLLFAARNAVLVVNGVPRPILLGARLPHLLLHRAGPVRIRVVPVEGLLQRPLVPDLAYRRPCSLSKLLAIHPLAFASREECRYIRPYEARQLEGTSKMGMFSGTYHFRVSNATMQLPRVRFVVLCAGVGIGIMLTSALC
jgi:hypothetical protein